MLKVVMLNPIMQTVSMLNVILPTVVAPPIQLLQLLFSLHQSTSIKCESRESLLKGKDQYN
jgi:hypothetical protein